MTVRRVYGLFVAHGGEAGRKNALLRVERAANPEWVRFMRAALVEVARHKPVFSADDVELLRVERKGPTTHEPRAMGPLMLQAARAMIIARTDDFAPTIRASCNTRPGRLWKSLIYTGAKR